MTVCWCPKVSLSVHPKSEWLTEVSYEKERCHQDHRHTDHVDGFVELKTDFVSEFQALLDSTRGFALTVE